MRPPPGCSLRFLTSRATFNDASVLIALQKSTTSSSDLNSSVNARSKVSGALRSPHSKLLKNVKIVRLAPAAYLGMEIVWIDPQRHDVDRARHAAFAKTLDVESARNP